MGIRMQEHIKLIIHSTLGGRVTMHLASNFYSHKKEREGGREEGMKEGRMKKSHLIWLPVFC